MGENIDKNKGILWVPALGVFTEISTWIALPVIVAVIIGKNLDTRYGTAPLMLLGSAGVSFLLSSFGIIRAVKKYSAKLKEEEKNK